MIDCDLHNEVPSLETLYPWLPDYWVDYCKESAFVGPDANDYPAGVALTVRPDAKPASGAAGSDSDLLRTQTLDAHNLDFGILNCAYRIASVHNHDLAAVLATAVNEWQIAEWLEADSRLRASLVVPSQNPQRAAAEVDRFGGHSGFVQVVLPVRAEALYGNLRYDPVFEAATRHDLVVGIHYGGAPGHPSTPSGWLSTFMEEYAAMASVFQSQVLSMIVEGVFDRFPSLRVALIEGGFTWMPSLMWRMDKEWKGLRHNTPWVKRPPSEYMRQHIRLTTTPVDAPPNQEQLHQIIEQMESDEMLMYGSDYPHAHVSTFGDSSDDQSNNAWLDTLESDLAQKIRSENARAFYRLS